MTRLTELFQISKLTATSTDTTGACAGPSRCAVEQVQHDAATEFLDRTTRWQSVLDPRCKDQAIQARWDLPFSIESYAVLYGPLGYQFEGVNSSTPRHNVKFLTLSNTVFDASNYVRCTQTSIADRSIALRYDICSFSASAQPGLLDNIVGATFTWKLRVAPNSTACQMNIFEMNLFGLPMSQVQPKNAGSGNGSTVATVNGPKGVSPGLIAGVSIAASVAAAVAALVFVRHRNLAKRKRAGRLLEAHLVAH
ncbi:hypothetical protein HDU78_000210 [Chytriomyces hyalinus]|nr:hypothetical protein HDU78_000210 [Chytriomyces hyalinus]